MAEDSVDIEMRSFILLAESLMKTEEPPVEEAISISEEEPASTPIISDLEDLVFRLRSHMESETEGDYALGFEMGMQRAADMIENLVRRHTEGKNLG